MKDFVKRVLRKSGWELRRIQSEPKNEMLQSLEWMRGAGVEVQTILDVGASNGRWTRLCASVFPAANYLMYEANPVHFSELKVFADGSTSRHAELRAAGPRSGSIRFDARDPLGGGLDLEGTNPHAIDVPMVTLDMSVKESGWNGPFLIKLDTHGYEKGILEGATKTLKHTNALIVECYNFKITKEALRFWEFCDFMGSLGFRPAKFIDVMNRRFDRTLWQMDILFLRKEWEGFTTARFS